MSSTCPHGPGPTASLLLSIPFKKSAGAGSPRLGISAHHLWSKRAPTVSTVLNLRGAGKGRGIVSIIYTIVMPQQTYQTSSSRGSLPYIHETSVIMYFDLLFFPLAHKELIKTHLTQSQKLPKSEARWVLENTLESHSGEIPPALVQSIPCSSSRKIPLMAHPELTRLPVPKPTLPDPSAAARDAPPHR